MSNFSIVNFLLGLLILFLIVFLIYTVIKKAIHSGINSSKQIKNLEKRVNQLEKDKTP